ncbi:Acyl-CoA_dh_2 domain-containing protein [Frankia sp. Hr75.2]|nr:Acyl-CoA_dh_2 domain-containing protein [Frankia sp. Hr75.2]
MVARAVAMRPMLLDLQDDAAARGTYSPETHEMFRSAGFYRLLQPRMFGGYEFDLTTFFRVMVEISRGDPGTGWCLCLAAGHVLPMASHWPAEVQVAMFSPDGEFAAPHSAGRACTAVPTTGGYLVNGVWPYSSGIPYSTHFMGTAHVPATDTAPERDVVLVVPRDVCDVADDWGDRQTLGLHASGSNTVRITEKVVPADQVVDFDWMTVKSAGTGTPGTELHGNPMYLGLMGALAGGEIASVMVGAAWAALDEFDHIARTKKTHYPPYGLRSEDARTHEAWGAAVSMADTAEATLLAVGDRYKEQCQHWATTGIAPIPEDTMRLSNSLQTVIRLSWEAVELLFRSAGTSVTRTGERLQRYYRDVSMQRTQWTYTSNLFEVGVGREHFGIAAPTPGDDA